MQYIFVVGIFQYMSFKVKLPCMYDEKRLLPNDFNVCGKNYFEKKCVQFCFSVNNKSKSSRVFCAKILAMIFLCF